MRLPPSVRGETRFSRLRDEEDGFILATSIIVLFLLLLLVTAAVALSVSASNTSLRTEREQQAMAAAQSGLRVGIYEVDSLGLDVSQLIQPTLSGLNLISGLQNQCVAQVGTQINGTSSTLLGNYCSPVHEDVGGGESFCYWLSPVLNVTLPLSLNVNTTLNQALTRTIVASGTAGGVTRWASEKISVSTGGSKLSGLIQLVLGTVSTLNVQLYKPVSGTYNEVKPSGLTGTSACPA